jgi:hypothetical protein
MYSICTSYVSVSAIHVFIMRRKRLWDEQLLSQHIYSISTSDQDRARVPYTMWINWFALFILSEEVNINSPFYLLMFFAVALTAWTQPSVAQCDRSGTHFILYVWNHVFYNFLVLQCLIIHSWHIWGFFNSYGTGIVRQIIAANNSRPYINCCIWYTVKHLYCYY